MKPFIEQRADPYIIRKDTKPAFSGSPYDDSQLFRRQVGRVDNIMDAGVFRFAVFLLKDLYPLLPLTLFRACLRKIFSDPLQLLIVHSFSFPCQGSLPKQKK